MGVGRKCVVETQSQPTAFSPMQETREATVFNNGCAPHQPDLKRTHSGMFILMADILFFVWRGLFFHLHL